MKITRATLFLSGNLIQFGEDSEAVSNLHFDGSVQITPEVADLISSLGISLHKLREQVIQDKMGAAVEYVRSIWPECDEGPGLSGWCCTFHERKAKEHLRLVF